MSHSAYVHGGNSSPSGLGFSALSMRSQLRQMQAKIDDAKKLREEHISHTHVEPEVEPESQITAADDEPKRFVIPLRPSNVIIYGGALAIGAYLIYRRKK